MFLAGECLSKATQNFKILTLNIFTRKYSDYVVKSKFYLANADFLKLNLNKTHPQDVPIPCGRLS